MVCGDASGGVLLTMVCGEWLVSGASTTEVECVIRTVVWGATTDTGVNDAAC